MFLVDVLRVRMGSSKLTPAKLSSRRLCPSLPISWWHQWGYVRTPLQTRLSMHRLHKSSDRQRPGRFCCHRPSQVCRNTPWNTVSIGSPDFAIWKTGSWKWSAKSASPNSISAFYLYQSTGKLECANVSSARHDDFSCWGTAGICGKLCLPTKK